MLENAPTYIRGQEELIYNIFELLEYFLEIGPNFELVYM